MKRTILVMALVFLFAGCPLFMQPQDGFCADPIIVGVPTSLYTPFGSYGLKGKDRNIVQIDSMKQVRDSLTSLREIKPSVERIAMVAGGMRSVPIQLMIQGRNLDDITMRTFAIRDAFAKLPAIVDVDTSIETGKPEVRVHIDREKAANFGVSAASIGNTVNTMIGGEIVGKYKDEKEGERYDIVARLTAPERDQPSALDILWVRSSTGELVRMKDVTHIETGKGPTIIMHYNRQRAATLFAGTEKTKPMAESFLTRSVSDNRAIIAGSGNFKYLLTVLREIPNCLAI